MFPFTCTGAASVQHVRRGFIGHQIKQAIICYQHALPGRSGTILREILRPGNSSRMREAVAACCGIRYLQSHLWHAGQEVAWYLKKKKIPLLQRKRHTL